MAGRLKMSLAVNLIWAAFLLPLSSFSQNGRSLDSLKKIITNKELHDTMRARAVCRYMRIVNWYTDSNVDALVRADSLSRKYNNRPLA